MSILASIVNKIAPIYPQAKRWLHSFNGGVFPQYRKELSSSQPIREPIIPERLVMMDCLAESLWIAQRDQVEPDEQAYLACLRQLLFK